MPTTPAPTGANPTIPMRQKMAREMCLKQHHDPELWDKAAPVFRERYYEMLDAALDLLMDPTAAIIDAGHDGYPRDSFIKSIRAIKEGK